MIFRLNSNQSSCLEDDNEEKNWYYEDMGRPDMYRLRPKLTTKNINYVMKWISTQDSRTVNQRTKPVPMFVHAWVKEQSELSKKKMRRNRRLDRTENGMRSNSMQHRYFFKKHLKLCFCHVCCNE